MAETPLADSVTKLPAVTPFERDARYALAVGFLAHTERALARRDALLREALQYLDMGKWSDLKQRIEAELGDSHDS